MYGLIKQPISEEQRTPVESSRVESSRADDKVINKRRKEQNMRFLAKSDKSTHQYSLKIGMVRYGMVLRWVSDSKREKERTVRLSMCVLVAG